MTIRSLLAATLAGLASWAVIIAIAVLVGGGF